MIEEYIQQAVDRLDNLPNNGFLTGSALYTTIYNIVHNENIPINTIDIYVEKHELYTQIEQSTVHEFITVGSKINIGCVETDSNVNIIPISNIKDYYEILKMYDINCCYVGYDLETKTPYYTQDFVDFIETKELKVVRPFTPSNTLCRLYQKHKEFKNSILNDIELDVLDYTYYSHICILKINKQLEQYFPLQNRFKLEDNYITPNNWVYSGFFKYTKEAYTKYTQIAFLLNKYHIEFNVSEVVFFVKHIKNDINKIKVWSYLKHFYTYPEYINGVDLENSIDDCVSISLKNRAIFEGMVLKQQIEINKYLDDNIHDVKLQKLLPILQDPLNLKLDELKTILVALKIKHKI